MKDGDLSNRTPSRVIVVYEGLVAQPPSKPAVRVQEQLYVRFRRWTKAAALWEFDDSMLAHLWDAAWRWDLPVDIATYLPAAYAEAHVQRLERLHLSFGHFDVYDSPESLARALLHMPSVASVVYSYPPRPLLFGGRGRYLEAPAEVQSWM